MLLLASACLAFGIVCRAATVEDLYTIVVEQDQNASDPRNDAIRRAMASVLVRVTGSRAAAAAAELQSIINDAERSYLNSYALLEEGEVRIGFIAAAVDAALESLNWPIWGAERPAIMVWVAVDDAFGGRAILSSGEFDNGYEHSPEMIAVMDGLRAELELAGYERGLPYVLPGMDFEDMRALDYADVWGNDPEVLGRAALRYATDAFAVARLRNSNFRSAVEWTLHIGGGQRIFLGRSLQEGIEWLAEQFAVEFRVVGGTRPLTLRISGVSSLDDYGRIMSYLGSVSVLERIDVQAFERGTLTLQVDSRGDQVVVSRVLTLSNILRLTPQDPDDPLYGDLEFELATTGLLQ